MESNGNECCKWRKAYAGGDEPNKKGPDRCAAPAAGKKAPGPDTGAGGDGAVRHPAPVLLLSLYPTPFIISLNMQQKYYLFHLCY